MDHAQDAHATSNSTTNGDAVNLPEKSKAASLLATLILFGAHAILTRAQAPIKINGSVTSDFEQPLSGARVGLYSLDRVLQTTSDVSGHFQFDNVGAGVYELQVTAAGFKTFTRPDLNVTDLARTVSGDKGTGLNVTMRVAPTDMDCGDFDSVVYDARKGNDRAALSGVVVAYDVSSKPIPNVDVFLLKMDLAGGEQRTNDHGEFQFQSIVPGRYAIVIRHPGYWEARSKLFWVARENTTQIRLKLLPSDRIVVCS